ncbi:hypothetical protein MRB53_024397 [Persea americana]|uniref:Uncharacterized protein n=1 Tax=Persea americana TaxID=3435 RepID=A0ACC2LC85_PERAE|nr:hypothetical protein MRB53_024397 [Persea americana]
MGSFFGLKGALQHHPFYPAPCAFILVSIYNASFYFGSCFGSGRLYRNHIFYFLKVLSSIALMLIQG